MLAWFLSAVDTCRGVIRFHSVDHCPDVALKRARQFVEARNHDRSRRARPRVANQGLNRQRIDTGSTAFGRQISGRTRRVLRMLDRRLQCTAARLALDACFWWLDGGSDPVSIQIPSCGLPSR
jgi:hypothetical protein